jgi:hypothetical protein
MKNVVPFKAPGIFERAGIDWTRAALTDRERSVREPYLTHECSCGPNGLVSVLLLATVARRCGAVADDLQGAADHAEILLAFKLHKHQDDVLTAAQSDVAEAGPLWL